MGLERDDAKTVEHVHRGESNSIKSPSHRALELQRAIGNRALARLLAREQAANTVEVYGERVRSRKEGDGARAAQIMEEVRSEYGVEVKSTWAWAGQQWLYSDLGVSQGELDKVSIEPWTMMELEAIPRGLAPFARILGPRRATSSRAGVPQEVTSIGKLSGGFDANMRLQTANGVLDANAQYFPDTRAIGLYIRGETYDADFKNDVPKQLVATIIHEAAHGLLASQAWAFRQAGGYWDASGARMTAPGIERPDSDYGRTNLHEDLSEAAKFYFLDPAGYRKKSSRRAAFFDQLTAGW